MARRDEGIYRDCRNRIGLHTLCDLSARRVIPAQRQPDTARAYPCGDLRVVVFICTVYFRNLADNLWLRSTNN
jgi:hypothetical protein